MSDTFIKLGIFHIKWYSLFIFIAMLVACLVIFKEAKKKNIDEEYLVNLIFYGIIIGIVGARLYYVIFNLDYYLLNLSEIFMIWKGGLAIHGAIIATLIFILFYSKKKKVSVLLILDVLVVGVIIAQAIGRWGNFFNQEAYGRIVSHQALKSLHLPTFIIDGMYINNYYREPTFLYESVLSFLGFVVLLVLRKYKKLKVGQLTSIYLIWYGIERLIIEGFRSDSLMLGPIKVAQLISIIAIISGFFLLISRQKKGQLYQSEKFN